MQLCIENVDQAGGCSYSYSCVYTDTISWASPTEPLPMIRDPRAVFDQLFGVGATPAARQRAAPRRPQHPRLGHRVGRRAEGDGSARPIAPGSPTTSTDVREIERRIQKVEAHEHAAARARELPGAPIGVPDSYEEHVKLMFDLQAVALRRRT